MLPPNETPMSKSNVVVEETKATTESSEIIKIEDDILEENLQQSREERRANGRMVALIIAVSLIGVAIYHAFLRKTAFLGGALISALIMILYGGWVVFLTKREKKRRLLMEQQMSEKISEKGSEFGTQEDLIAAPVKTTIISQTTKTSRISNGNTNAKDPTTTRKKKRRHKSDGRFDNPETAISANIHKSKGKSRRHHKLVAVQTAEAISKMRQDRVPLCRTFSAP